MQRTLLKSKLHKATLTGADLHYNGSISIGTALMKAADLLSYEQLDVYDSTNGDHLATYDIEGNPVEICLNGANEWINHKSKKLLLDGHNSIVEWIDND